MPLSLPALSDLRTQFRGNFAARVPGFDQTLRRSVIGVLADVLAGGVYAFVRALYWISRQLFIASAETPYLDRRLSEYGLSRIQAVAAAGSVTFTVTGAASIALGTQLQTTDLSLQFTTTAAATASGAGTVSVPVACSAAGSAGNLVAGTVLNLVAAIPYVNGQAAVATGGLNGGVDQEIDDSFRSRGLARIQQPPQGGAATDFWAWAKTCGVPTRAWVFPANRGIGSCDVTFTVDTRANPIPLAADIAAVQAAIAAAAPVIGSYIVYAPTADALAITVHGVPSANRAAVTAALNALVASVPPGGATAGDGVTVPLAGALYPLQLPGILYLEWIEAAINGAAQLQSFDLVAPAADVTFATGHLPAPPTITFT